MAEVSTTNGDPVGLMKVWTFIIKGGQPATIRLRDRLGPALEHEGRTSIWKMMGTEDEAAAVEQFFTGPLVGASVQRHTETEDDEMLAIRQERLTGLAEGED